jgi:hypothetical protein
MWTISYSANTNSVRKEQYSLLLDAIKEMNVLGRKGINADLKFIKKEKESEILEGEENES